jgi:hypothetical protein
MEPADYKNSNCVWPAAWNFTHTGQIRVREQIRVTLKTPIVSEWFIYITWYMICARCKHGSFIWSCHTQVYVGSVGLRRALNDAITSTGKSNVIIYPPNWQTRHSFSLSHFPDNFSHCYYLHTHVHKGAGLARYPCARRTIAEAKQHWLVTGWVTNNLLSRARPCFGRHVKPLVSHRKPHRVASL